MTGALRDVFFANNDEWRYTPHALRAHGRYHLPYDDELPSNTAGDTQAIQAID